MDDPVHHVDDSLLTDESKIWGNFGPLRIAMDLTVSGPNMAMQLFEGPIKINSRILGFMVSY